MLTMKNSPSQYPHISPSDCGYGELAISPSESIVIQRIKSWILVGGNDSGREGLSECCVWKPEAHIALSSLRSFCPLFCTGLRTECDQPKPTPRVGRGSLASLHSCAHLLRQAQRSRPRPESPAARAAASGTAAINGLGCGSRCVRSCISFWLRFRTEEVAGRAEGWRRPGARRPALPRGLQASRPPRPPLQAALSSGCAASPFPSPPLQIPAGLSAPPAPQPPAGPYFPRAGGASEAGTNGLTRGSSRRRGPARAGAGAKPVLRPPRRQKCPPEAAHQLCSRGRPPCPGGRGDPDGGPPPSPGLRAPYSG